MQLVLDLAGECRLDVEDPSGALPPERLDAGAPEHDVHGVGAAGDAEHGGLPRRQGVARRGDVDAVEALAVEEVVGLEGPEGGAHGPVGVAHGEREREVVGDGGRMRRGGEREAGQRGVLDLEPGLRGVAVAEDEDDDDGDGGDDDEPDEEAARAAAVLAEAGAALAVVAHGGRPAGCARLREVRSWGLGALAAAD